VTGFHGHIRNIWFNFWVDAVQIISNGQIEAEVMVAPSDDCGRVYDPSLRSINPAEFDVTIK